MRELVVVSFLALSACGAAPQPKSARTVAAYEIPISDEAERGELIMMLRRAAKPEGFHVDAATSDELKTLSEVSPLTINAAVWRGKDDEEAVASVMDVGQPGLPLLTFSESTVPARTIRFRDQMMKEISQRWPKTQPLPITPTGAIPLHEDLVLTNGGYRVKRSEASKYKLAVSSPLTAN